MQNCAGRIKQDIKGKNVSHLVHISEPELHLSPTFCLFCLFLDAVCNSFIKVRGLRSEDEGGKVSERWTANKRSLFSAHSSTVRMMN